MSRFMYPRQRKKVKARLFVLQGGKCCYCGCQMDMAPSDWPLGGRTPPDFATLEHLQRLADGGLSIPDNMAVACFDCNTQRGETNWVEFKTLRAA